VSGRAVACRLRIYHYYLPVFFWVQQQLQQHKQKHQGQTAPPLVVSTAALPTQQLSTTL
jgi:D-glycerate 3-kinase